MIAQLQQRLEGVSKLLVVGLVQFAGFDLLVGLLLDEVGQLLSDEFGATCSTVVGDLVERFDVDIAGIERNPRGVRLDLFAHSEPPMRTRGMITSVITW